MKESRLALFWYIDNTLYGCDWAVEDCDERLGQIIPPASHAGVWEEIRIRNNITSKSATHDYYPRGRIVYNAPRDEYHVLADPKIIYNQKAKKIICEKYNLSQAKTHFQTNPSYQSRAESLLVE